MSTDAPTPPPRFRSLTELRAKLGAALRDGGHLTEATLRDLQQRAAWEHEALDHLLLRDGILSEKTLQQQLSTLSGIPLLREYRLAIDDQIIQLVPPRAVTRYRIVPLALEDRRLILATDHLREPEEEEQLQVVLGRPVGWALCTRRELDDLVTHFYGVGIDIFLELENGGGTTAGAGRRDIPAFVDAILRDAIQSQATDIHFEPGEDVFRVRYRIDGVLYAARLPRGVEQHQRAILSSLKVMAQLDIAERRLPQDGRLEKSLDDQSFDIRVSVLPTRYGESIELRILNRSATFLRMDELGLPAPQRRTLEEILRQPHGLLLFTGPTGSGKTTSLYAALAEMNDNARKIITIEDPVEYQIRGITQLQVHHAIGFTFASGLRSILRHDPDLILVGEIRDDATADIAVSAALTGHLVLSTLHTNDSASAPMRLIDMGIEPYLVASSLQGIVAQRLVRRLCPDCREPAPLDDSYQAELRQWLPESQPVPAQVWRGRGCPHCRFTGYQGRRALYEILEVDDQLRSLIVERATSSVLLQHAAARGLIPLRQAGWALVLRGETSLEDLLRVTSHRRPTA